MLSVWRWSCVSLLTTAAGLLVRDVEEFAVRGSFSKTCALYPNQRIVVVTVNYEYVDFFVNWLHFAKDYLRDTERLVVYAEDSAAVPALNQVLAGSDVHFTVVSPNALVSPKSRNRGTSLLDVNINVGAPYGTQEYGEVVWRRPLHLLTLLRRGCTVLYVDIDTVWAKDPFLDIGQKPGHDMYLVEDDAEKKRPDWTYFCSCFLYLQPKPAVRQLLSLWSDFMNGNKNQHVFNRVLVALKGAVDFAVLPMEKYPPGPVSHKYPSATVVHANWVNGHDAKVCFMQRRGVWSETRGQNETSCEDPLPFKKDKM